jgi:hypothetical protein
MPETSVHEDGQTRTNEDEVGTRVCGAPVAPPATETRGPHMTGQELL